MAARGGWGGAAENAVFPLPGNMTWANEKETFGSLFL